MDRFEALRLFVAVADHEGFAAGARAIGASAASATRAVTTLEERLGVKLFVRTTRSVRLTEPGRIYLDRSRQVLDDLGQADALASGAAAVPTGRLRITTPVRFGILHLMPVIGSFLDQNDAVTADVVFVDRVVNLIEEGFDVALRIGPLPDSGLVARRVGEVRRVVCAAPDYLDRRGEPEHPDDLGAHAIVSATTVTATDEWKFGDKVSATVNPRIRMNSVEAAITGARLAHGLTRVLSYQISDDVAEGRLRIVLRDFEPAPLPVHLVHAEGRIASAKVRAFIDHSVEALKERLARLERL
ncbi:LysR family transcriptional regulator [Sulfitobacter sp. D35]|uniref:LysR family transcriptional regulator n=1 Tax=Sulfitobacter sp. D35 TaxID=3083252 RepID=UPI00296FD812|nr:LysR family transcriptional regulator [Sulfitobacter sp. D35]MDW4497198.1 LysR family transcriptional regulator [Sulfitobacter sp. D35]